MNKLNQLFKFLKKWSSTIIYKLKEFINEHGIKIHVMKTKCSELIIVRNDNHGSEGKVQVEKLKYLEVYWQRIGGMKTKLKQELSWTNKCLIKSKYCYTVIWI